MSEFTEDLCQLGMRALGSSSSLIVSDGRSALVSRGLTAATAIVDNLLISASGSPRFRTPNSIIPAKAVPPNRACEKIRACAFGVPLITYTAKTCYGKCGVTDNREGIIGHWLGHQGFPDCLNPQNLPSSVALSWKNGR